MTKYREILRLHSRGMSQRSIAIACGASRNTVSSVILRFKKTELELPLTEDMTDHKLQALLFPETHEYSSERKMPDLAYIQREMKKPGVTLKLLWTEYCAMCRISNELPLMYSRFCYHYQKFSEQTRASMHIPRKPAEQTEVDWAGQKMQIFDRNTGETIAAYLFVGVLSYSQYAFAEAFTSQNQDNWIAAHVNMYRYFGGVTKILIPDNLKTGVTKADNKEPVINRVYLEMAEHYDTVVLPARVRKPKDKPNAEGTVKILSNGVIAALRDMKFFSLAELNRAIRLKMEEINTEPFQKKDGSRQSVFLGEEKPLLLQLPASEYELSTWKVATVQYNYHVSIDKMLYSVPYEYIKRKVDVRITRNVIEIFFNDIRICSHPRLYGRTGQYNTVMEHMPIEHREYLQWDAERFIKWANKVGQNTEITVRAILEFHKVEQQGYRSCMALLKLADKYSITKLEAACAKALYYTATPSFKSVKTILSTGQDKIGIETFPIATGFEDKSNSAEEYSFTRGAEYYGRKKR